jgi:hypothetical protein
MVGRVLFLAVAAGALAGRGEALVRAELSALSPAVALRADGQAIRLFASMEAWGMSGPRWLAWCGPGGVRCAAAPANAAPAEPWVVCWFGDADGFRDFDVPWLVVFPSRPTQVTLAPDGLTLRFTSGGAEVRAMPLWGYRRLLHGGEGATAGWAQGLPPDVAERARRLARTVLSRPRAVTCVTTADPSSDVLEIALSVSGWDDANEFGWEGDRIIPLSPPLVHALTTGFPCEVEGGQLVDADLFTPYGPWGGVRSSAGCRLRFPLLQYVNEAELPVGEEALADPVAREALSRLRTAYADKFRQGTIDEIWDHGGADNYCWQAMGDRYYAMGLPYAGEAAGGARAALQSYVSGYVLDESHYVPRRGVLLLEGPGIGSWGVLGDAGKFSSNLLETLWAYGHNTDDWETLREHWPTIQRFFVTPLEIRQATFGREAIAEMGDEAAPALCYARIAAQLDDRAEYARGCEVFVRELVHLWLKVRGAELFRANWPVSSMEPYEGAVYLTNLWGGTAGWQIDGPQYPRETGERQYTNRWVRFSQPDVARFLREHLAAELRPELDGMLTTPGPYRLRQSTAHIQPSLEQLRSLLLGESIQDLARLSPPETWPGGRAADRIAYYLAFLRAAAPPQQGRLVPADTPPSSWASPVPWQPDEDGALVVQCTTMWEGGPCAPTLTWFGWHPPHSAAGMPRPDCLSFGQIVEVP